MNKAASQIASHNEADQRGETPSQPPPLLEANPTTEPPKFIHASHSYAPPIAAHNRNPGRQ
ncbi:hypothetical protein BU14_0032s0033 [Porphyra umbilicalis]|uniref:Uncharacterized protein n=1 Tax=Porphyra umbilicalis TaxID=2786 RepID=A0A1X6PIX5_PORUM|nr:hypothetical protein BU14_0032s0033 [Porphyra umbilicalis]|eukprot:OSX80775.1 hypothetical protein BU14_0032s0033 [Porphyra umbilicalis]